MKKPDPKKQPRAFDIHRTLPRQPSAIPKHLHNRRDVPIHEAAKKPIPGKSWARPFKKLVLVLALLLVVSAAIIGIWDARNISAASQKMFGSGNIFSMLNSGSLKTDNNGQVKVLIAGYSIDDPAHPGASLTDSIILLSMNPAKHTGYMLSIPRDLYVKIPGFGYGKINEAYEDGGMPLLQQIVESDFQTQIGYWALLNYAAVRQAVNALGGITLNIASPDPRGLYDPNISPVDGGPLKLSNGVQSLDGQTALNLTRARGETYGSYGFPQSDFDRTQHQRQVFTAIKDKISWTLILNPRKNSRILDAVASNVKTNIQVSEARPLFGLFNRIPSSSLQSLSLRNLNGKNYLASSYYEGSTLSPAAGLDDYSQISAALQQISQ